MLEHFCKQLAIFIFWIPWVGRTCKCLLAVMAATPHSLYHSSILLIFLIIFVFPNTGYSIPYHFRMAQTNNGKWMICFVFRSMLIKIFAQKQRANGNHRQDSWQYSTRFRFLFALIYCISQVSHLDFLQSIVCQSVIAVSIQATIKSTNSHVRIRNL